MSLEPPPHKALGRDFFVVGAQLANDDDHPSTNTSSVINTTIHKTPHDNPSHLVSISDWLLKTLQNAPPILLRIVRRVVPRGNGCCVLDFGGVRQMVVLMGDDVTSLPNEIPRLTVSVKIAGANDNDDQQAAITCSLQDSIWEHVVVAIDLNGSEHATRIVIRTERTGTVSRTSVSSGTDTTRLWSKSTNSNAFHLDRIEHFASVTEAIEQDEEDVVVPAAASSGKRGTLESTSKPAKKTKTKQSTEPPVDTEPVELKPEEHAGKGVANGKRKEKKTKKDKAPNVESTTSAATTSISSNGEAVAAKEVVVVVDAPKATAGKRKKDPNQPKRAQSAYNYFFSEAMAKSRKEYPDKDASFHSKSVGEQWKNLSNEDKAKYEALSNKDHERYRTEMESYVPAELSSDDENEKGKKKKRKKDPDHPKKAMSAYLFYCNEQRPLAKALHTDMAFGDLTKVVSEAWKKLSPEEKRTYEDAAKESKEKYDGEMAEYTSTKPAPAGAKESKSVAVDQLLKLTRAVDPVSKSKQGPSVRKSLAKPKKADDDSSESKSSIDSNAKTVGEDSDSSATESESEMRKVAERSAKETADGSSTNDDDTADVRKKHAVKATENKAVPKSPSATKKRGEKHPSKGSERQDVAAPGTPKRSPHNKAESPQTRSANRSGKKEHKSDLGKKEQKNRRGAKGK